jgi:hypothetical protein
MLKFSMRIAAVPLAFRTPTTQFSGFIYLNLLLGANEVLLHIILISVGAGLDRSD